MARLLVQVQLPQKEQQLPPAAPATKQQASTPGAAVAVSPQFLLSRITESMPYVNKLIFLTIHTWGRRGNQHGLEIRKCWCTSLVLQCYTKLPCSCEGRT